VQALAFLQDLTLILSSAAGVLLLFRRFRQPPVLGYLLVGLLLGPHTPPMNLVSDMGSLEALAEIGVVFLLFALGVEFNLKRLWTVGSRAMVCAVIEVLIMAAIGYAMGLGMGLEPLGALLLGGVVSVASTAIVARLLLERTNAGGAWGELVSGVLIAEDVLAVLMIAFFASAGQMDALSFGALFGELARFGMLVTLVLVTGLLLLPGILAIVERSGMKEVSTLVILGTCFGVSFLTQRLGFSAGLGAFLAGAMMSETAASARVAEVVEPFKDLFGAVFFVAVGMMIDPTWALIHWQLSLGLVSVILLARFAANAAAFVAVGEDARTVALASTARLPIGEFSFILAQVGDQRGLTEWPLYPVAVLLSIATTFTSATLLPRLAAHPSRVEAMIPPPLLRFLAEYRVGLRRLSVPRRARIVFDLTRPSLVQIFLNIMGLSGVFLAAGAAERRLGLDARYPGAVWVLTAFLTLPFLLALWRKAQAVTLILLEAITTRGADPRPPAETHPTVTRIMLGVTTVAVAWWYLSMSLALLPPWPYTLIPLGVIVGVGVLVWQRMNQLYSRIQVRLRDTLEKGQARPEAGATVLTHIIAASSGATVQILSFRVGKHAKGAGRSLKELAICERTGADILQINRHGEAFSAPGPSMHLRDGDEVLVVGMPDQLSKAGRLIESG